MSLFTNSAFGPPYTKTRRLNTDTPPQYLFGEGHPDGDPFVFRVTSVSLNANVATIGVSIKSGGGSNPLNVPTVGAKMGVQGTQTNSSLFNVDPTTVSSVDYDAATGTGTISFALEGSNVTQTDDVGSLVVWAYETPDLVSEGSASASYALFYGPDESDNSRCAFAEAKWTGTMPTTATVVLEVSNYPDNSRFQVVQNSYGTSPTATVAASDALASVADGAVTQSGANYQFLIGKFVRAKVLSMTGGDETTGLVVTIFG
ncbi:MAG: hypothetical protein ACLGXA_21125 [Acidobacteriota bacterium]